MACVNLQKSLAIPEGVLAQNFWGTSLLVCGSASLCYICTVIDISIKLQPFLE